MSGFFCKDVTKLMMMMFFSMGTWSLVGVQFRNKASSSAYAKQI